MSDFKQELAELKRQIAELEKEASKSPELRALNRLHRDLRASLTGQNTRAARISVIQPTPPPLALNPDERAVFYTFLDYHQALLQYAGGGYYLPRGEWLNLADVAADMTAAIYSGGYKIVPFPNTTGIWAWDGGSQLWVPNLTAPQTGAVIPAGQIGEIKFFNLPPSINLPVKADTTSPSLGNYGSVTLTQGVWMVTGAIAWDMRSVSGFSGSPIVGFAAYSTTFPPPGTLEMAGTNVMMTPIPSNIFQSNIVTQQLRITTATSTVYLIGCCATGIVGDQGKNVPTYGFLNAWRIG